MFKLDLEKAEEPEIKLPISVGSSKKQESSRKTSISACLWLCGSQQTVENTYRDGNTRPPYLPPEKCVCRSKKKTVRTGHGSKLGTEYIKAVNCHPAYLTYMQSTSWEAQAGIKIAGRNINNLRYADDTTLMAESEEELKSLSPFTFIKRLFSSSNFLS